MTQTFTPAPKPTPRTEAERLATRIAQLRKRERAKTPLPRQSLKQKAKYPKAFSSITKKPVKIASRNPLNRAKRDQRNREYYASPEWRAKKKAVHERDGYRCVEMIPYIVKGGPFLPDVGTRLRCPNFGMNINGKQTAKGLVAEEKSYGHRGTPGAIDRIVTRCKECDRRLTPLERINHLHGFKGGAE